MLSSTLYYILSIEEYQTLPSMLKRLEEIFQYEIPFLSKVKLENQKIVLREKINKLDKTPNFLKMNVKEYGCGEITIECRYLN